MSQFKNLLVFDLSSYGCGFAIINQFVDEVTVKVFEISPCGQSALLILSAGDVLTLQLIKAESQVIFKSQILSLELIENIHEELLSAYLSQNNPKLQKMLLVLENSFLSTTMQVANKYLKSGLQLVDFRIIRTYPKNVILVFTADSSTQFSQLDLVGFNKTIVENIQPVLKSFFEV